MTTSVLDSTKQKLGLVPSYTVFDDQIIGHINSVFGTLHQLGVGPEDGFTINGPDETWEDFQGSQRNIQAVQTYMYVKVRLYFDPPATSFAITAMENQAAELEWRLNVVMEGVRHPWTDPSIEVEY